MKTIILKTLKAYKLAITPLLLSLFPTYGCKFWPTCSEYTYEAVSKFGGAKGLFAGVKRVVRCNPFSEGGVDEVSDSYSKTTNHKHQTPNKSQVTITKSQSASWRTKY